MTQTIIWSYAWSIAGICILTVFLLLVVLIVVISLEGLVMGSSERSSKRSQKRSEAEVKAEAPAPTVTAQSDDSGAELAAIAMALQLHFNSHDYVPNMLYVKEGERASSPWCAKNLGMNKLK